MKVRYETREYVFDGDLDCKLFKGILELNEDEIDLTLYEDIFLMLYNNTLNLDQIEVKDYKHVNDGLSYFGSKYNLYNHVKNKIHSSKIKEFENYVLSECKMDFTFASHPLLSEQFFKRYLDSVENKRVDSFFWIKLSRRNFSEDFFEKYIAYVDWNSLCYNQNISESFFERHLDKVNFESLSENENISIDFFKRHNKVSCIFYVKNPSLFYKDVESETNKLFSFT